MYGTVEPKASGGVVDLPVGPNSFRCIGTGSDCNPGRVTTPLDQRGGQKSVPGHMEVRRDGVRLVDTNGVAAPWRERGAIWGTGSIPSLPL